MFVAIVFGAGTISVGFLLRWATGAELAPEACGALVAIAAFVGGQIIVAGIQEWRADRDFGRQRLVRAEEQVARRREENERELRKLNLARIEGTRHLVVGMLQMATLVCQGNIDRARDVWAALNVFEAARNFNPSLIGSAEARTAFEDAMEAASAAFDEPNPGAVMGIPAAQAMVMIAFQQQEERAAIGEPLLAAPNSEQTLARLDRLAQKLAAADPRWTAA